MIHEKHNGFTLIELLIVIAIVAILAGIVLIAVNPGRQLAQARNTERWAEVNAILSAVNQFEIDYGVLPDCATTTVSDIGTGDCDLGATDLLLGAGFSGEQALVPGFIAGIPAGPDAACSVSDTCYNIATTATDPARVTISAPNAELGVLISVTR